VTYAFLPLHEVRHLAFPVGPDAVLAVPRSIRSVASLAGGARRRERRYEGEAVTALPFPDDAGPCCDACKGRGWVANDDVPRAVCGTCNGTGYPKSWAAGEIARLDAEVARLTAALTRSEEARGESERRIRAVEQACDMPLAMIATTLDAHRVTAQADHQRAEEAELELVGANAIIHDLQRVDGAVEAAEARASAAEQRASRAEAALADLVGAVERAERRRRMVVSHEECGKASPPCRLCAARALLPSPRDAGEGAAP
jgi:hypothetical protein